MEANYGQAGSAPGRTAESEIGRYPEGNYGADCTVDPTRKAGTADEANRKTTDPQ